MEDEDVVDPKEQCTLTAGNVSARARGLHMLAVTALYFASAVWLLLGLFLSMVIPTALLLGVPDLLFHEFLWSHPPLAVSLAVLAIVSGLFSMLYIYRNQHIVFDVFPFLLWLCVFTIRKLGGEDTLGKIQNRWLKAKR